MGRVIEREQGRADETPYAERVCSHGKRFDTHCKECQMQGFCGCPDCVEDSE